MKTIACFLVIASAAFTAGCGHSSFSAMPSRQGAHVHPFTAPPHIASSSTVALYSQVYDGNINLTDIPAEAPNVAFVWGAGTNKASTWIANNAAILVGFYMPGFGDADSSAFGNLGHGSISDLTWWKANHPGWIEYTCATNGGGVHTTPASFDGLSNVVLDIGNQDVINYQGDLVNTAYANWGFNAVDFDLINIDNFTHACGHYDVSIPTQWDSQYTGYSSDTAYTANVKNWANQMQIRLHGSYAISFAMAINMNINSFANPASCTGYPCGDAHYVMAHSDIENDEPGFTGQAPDGSWPSAQEFQNVLDWGKEVQAGSGEDFLVDALFHQSTSITQDERRYTFGSYLLAKHGHAAMPWDKSPWSGSYKYDLNSPSEFSHVTGLACGDYNLSTTDSHLFYRIFHKAVSIVNADGSNTYSVSINTFSWNQAGNGATDYQSYFDVETTNVLTQDAFSLAPHTAKVIFSNGATDLGCPSPPSPLP